MSKGVGLNPLALLTPEKQDNRPSSGDVPSKMSVGASVTRYDADRPNSSRFCSPPVSRMVSAVRVDIERAPRRLGGVADGKLSSRSAWVANLRAAHEGFFPLGCSQLARPVAFTTLFLSLYSPFLHNVLPQSPSQRVFFFTLSPSALFLSLLSRKMACQQLQRRRATTRAFQERPGRFGSRVSKPVD